MAAETLEEKVQRLETMVRRSQDIQEIQNVMSRHCFMDASGLNREQINEIWAQTVPDVSLAHNHGMYIGLESIIHSYCDLSDVMREKEFEQLKKMYPDIPGGKEYKYAGWMKMHTNCTPYIIVAGDGKTAKGTWESPGFVTGVMNEKLQAVWMWERFALDFLKENGKWKIWHFNAMVQFMTPYEKSWVEGAEEEKLIGGIPGFEPDKKITRNEPYHPKKLVGPLTPNFPKQPVPYETFSETFSYGP